MCSWVVRVINWISCDLRIPQDWIKLLNPRGMELSDATFHCGQENRVLRSGIGRIYWHETVSYFLPVEKFPLVLLGVNTPFLFFISSHLHVRYGLIGLPHVWNYTVPDKNPRTHSSTCSTPNPLLTNLDLYVNFCRSWLNIIKDDNLIEGRTS